MADCRGLIDELRADRDKAEAKCLAMKATVSQLELQLRAANEEVAALIFGSHVRNASLESKLTKLTKLKEDREATVKLLNEQRVPA